MRRLFTIISLAVAGLLAVEVAYAAGNWNLWKHNHVFSGVISDCETGEVIQGASIELWQQKLVTWDQIHKFTATSDAQGRFTIPYNVGSDVNVRTSKEGYLLSDDYSFPGAVRIGLIKVKTNEADLWPKVASRYSRNCKRAFECQWRDGVKFSGDTCGSLRPLVSSTPTGK